MPEKTFMEEGDFVASFSLYASEIFEAALKKAEELGRPLEGVEFRDVVIEHGVKVLEETGAPESVIGYWRADSEQQWKAMGLDSADFSGVTSPDTPNVKEDETNV